MTEEDLKFLKEELRMGNILTANLASRCIDLELEVKEVYHNGLADGVARGRMQVLEEGRSGDVPLLSVLMSAKKDAKREVVEWGDEMCNSTEHRSWWASTYRKNCPDCWQAYLEKEGLGGVNHA